MGTQYSLSGRVGEGARGAAGPDCVPMATGSDDHAQGRPSVTGLSMFDPRSSQYGSLSVSRVDGVGTTVASTFT